GGGEANLWDVAGAYSSMGRTLLNYSNTRKKYVAGNFNSLNYLKKEIPEKKKFTEETELLNASSIWFTLNAMTELVRPGDYIGWAQFSNKTRIAWKTGTSFGFRDAWAVGLNDKYTVAVWVGNASGEGRPELTGSKMAAPLMFDIFNYLQKRTWFAKPTSDMQKVKFCKQSGFRASDICPDVEDAWCQKGSERVAVCKFHKTIHLDETGSWRVNSNCYSVDKMKHVAWFVVSPMQEYFFKQHNFSYRSLPDYLESCTSEQSLHQLEIVYPRPDFKIYVPIDETGTRGKCIFKAAHKNQEATLFWYLDGTYIGSTQKFHQLSAVPDKGKHKLTITDNFGETSVCAFETIDK
ncbi:MAG: pbpC, partial [Bacteroidetes bacterium]|nr:pbpC [Bacteroidota bacterium]